MSISKVTACNFSLQVRADFPILPAQEPPVPVYFSNRILSQSLVLNYLGLWQSNLKSLLHLTSYTGELNSIILSPEVGSCASAVRVCRAMCRKLWGPGMAGTVPVNSNVFVGDSSTLFFQLYKHFKIKFCFVLVFFSLWEGSFKARWRQCILAVCSLIAELLFNVGQKITLLCASVRRL